MINKTKKLGNNANRKKANGVEDKRFSKAKFKKDNGSMSLSEKVEVKEEKQLHNSDYYYQKFEQRLSETHKWAGGKVESVKHMILVQPSIHNRDYDVLPKGQCVKVTTFIDCPWRQVEASDGRVGIIPTHSTKIFVKPLNFATTYKGV